MRRAVVLAMAASAVGLLHAAPAPAAGPTRAASSATAQPSASTDCRPGAPPYDLPGAELTPEIRVSKDDPPVRYARWRGFMPSFDGMPLSVDVTVPCDAEGPLPTVVMAHGFTDDKTIWQETDRSDTVRSTERPGSNDRWNNIWFASRGYAVLNYTARGWRDSCGPDTPEHTVEDPAPQCAGHEFWIHLDDKRWEARDAQWLTGALVQGGLADPQRLAITGGSYGGAPSAMAALLADRMVCGADPVPAELGEDPCVGKSDGELVPWTTPDASTELNWAAALPMYTFGNLLDVLAPNGRWSDGADRAPERGSAAEPFGVPLEGTVSGLLIAAQMFGSVAPEGVDPESDLITSTARLMKGDPFPPDDPAVRDGVRTYTEWKSPVSIEPQGRVPIFWVQGMTDALFPATEALTVRDHVLAADADYPFKLFLGDLGHDYAAERQDDWDLVKEQMNEFLDHYLSPDGGTPTPEFDVGVSVVRCLDESAPQQYVAASDWLSLSPTYQSFESDDPGRTSTREQGPAGVATDPISGATLPGPDSYRGCRIMRPAEVDPTVATYEFTLDDDLTMVGSPVVEVGLDTSAGGIPLAVRMWHVQPSGAAASGAAQGLVTRGVYRLEDSASGEQRVRFQLRPMAYRFAAGDRIKVEVTANDSPYLQASSIDADVNVRRVRVDVPLLGEVDEHGRVVEAAASEPVAEQAVDEVSDGDSTAWWWLAAVPLAAAGAAAVAVNRQRSRRPEEQVR